MSARRAPEPRERHLGAETSHHHAPAPGVQPGGREPEQQIDGQGGDHEARWHRARIG